MADNINFISASSLPEATGEAVDVICIENGEMKKKSGTALGGAGVSSWNDLTDKPFGEKTFETILEESEVIPDASNSNMGGVETVFDLTIGETYIVTWNGTEYSCVCIEAPISETMTVPALGNSAALGGEDTGEPFALAPIAAQGATMVMVLDGSTSATVKIEKETYTKLPVEYFPENLDGIVVCSSTEGSVKQFKITVDDSGTITATEVV